MKSEISLRENTYYYYYYIYYYITIILILARNESSGIQNKHGSGGTARSRIRGSAIIENPLIKGGFYFVG